MDKKSNIITDKNNMVRIPEKNIINSLSLNPFSLWLRKLSIPSINFYLPYTSSLALPSKVTTDSSLHQLKLLSALRLIQASTNLSSKVQNRDINNVISNNEEKENNLKKIIEIRNLLVILKNMHNHIEFLIGLRKKLILKRRIKII